MQTEQASLAAKAQQFLEIPLPEEPDDFKSFWKRTYEESRNVPLRLASREVESRFDGYRLFEVEYDSLAGVRIGGWITVPREVEPERLVVMGHGYGGRESPGLPIPGPPAAAIFFCARGFHRSAREDLPNNAAFHVVHGIQSPETYMHRGCVADLWGAASAVSELYPHLASRLDYLGASFGGGIGALAVPWDPRFRKAFLDVPSFGNHPVRLQIPCCGSGEAVRVLYRRNPGITETLQYFDSATAAKYFKIPVYVAAAVEDPVVPPPGQFAVFKAIPGEKQLFIRKTGHPDDPQDQMDVAAALDRWFRE
jgi:cephalosporin-C deacetylase